MDEIKGEINENTFEIQGIKMFLDPIDSLRIFTGSSHESATTELFKKKIKKGDVILDIGAHIGYFTLLFAQLTGENGRVYAFEPAPANFALLKKNVEINEYKNVVLVNKAVSDKNGKSVLYLSSESTGIHKIYDTNDGRKSIEVESIRLDDYFGDYNGKVDWIKIDIEGAEWLALKGMALLLEKNRSLKIVSEFFPHFIKESGMDPKEYLMFLKRCGFGHMYNIDEDKKIIEIQRSDELLKMYTPENKNITNLLFIRNGD